MRTWSLQNSLEGKSILKLKKKRRVCSTATKEMIAKINIPEILPKPINAWVGYLKAYGREALID